MIRSRSLGALEEEFAHLFAGRGVPAPAAVESGSTFVAAPVAPLPIFANTVTGQVETLSQIQQDAINHTGTYENRAEVEAQMAEAVRIGREQGLEVSCVLDTASNWSGNTIFSSRCSVNGRAQSEAPQLLRPGGFQTALQSNDDVPGWLPRDQVQAYRDSHTGSTTNTTTSTEGAGSPAEPGSGSPAPPSKTGSSAGSSQASTLFSMPAWLDDALQFVSENPWLVAGSVVGLLALTSGKARR